MKKYNRTNCCSCLGNKCSLRKCKSQQKHSLIDAQWAKKWKSSERLCCCTGNAHSMETHSMEKVPSMENFSINQTE